jgi:hypothetical protein
MKPGGNFGFGAGAVVAMALNYGDSKAKAKKIKRSGTEAPSVVTGLFEP